MPHIKKRPMLFALISKSLLAFFGFSILFTVSCSRGIDLSGKWSFQLGEPNDIAREVYNRELSGSIILPGSLQQQGFGNKPSKLTEWTSRIGMKLLDDARFEQYLEAEDFKCPFWLTPDRHYVGQAWYQRKISVPADWNKKRIVLYLERPHWETTVWIDNRKVGSQNALGTPHKYDITDSLRPGKTHRLTILVDNNYIIPIGKDSHSISDQTQSNWNGIIGKIALETTEQIWFEDVQLYPDVKNKLVRIVGRLGNRTSKSGQGTLVVTANSYNGPRKHIVPAVKKNINWQKQAGQFELIYEMTDDCLLWDEYQPALYTLQLKLQFDGQTTEYRTSFGMRELDISDRQFTINSRKLFLRGTLECCIFPLNGYPPTDVRQWKRLIRIAKSYGLNHFRFHSWCPPQAGFIAADEEGFYLQVEASCWANMGSGNDFDKWIYRECRAILSEYGNHPSFILMAVGNEPAGKNRNPFLSELVKYLVQQDCRRFFTGGSGWPQLSENQYHIVPKPRLQRWPSLQLDKSPQTWDDYREYVNSQEVPVISHEIGQWCVYPDLSEDVYYTGVLKAKNIEIFRDKLSRAGMADKAKDFLNASGRFQVLLYKQEIEAALRTPGFGGFQLLDLHDFPGQGTAPVGVLNALWQNKGYVTARQYRRFCNDVVPLLRMKKRLFQNKESFRASLDIANYYADDLKDTKVIWQIRNELNQVLSTGCFENVNIPTGGLTSIGSIEAQLDNISSASKLNISVQLPNTDYGNDWDIWVYPDNITTHQPDDIVITRNWQKALNELKAGKKVLLVPLEDTIKSDTIGTFRPIFWNRITFPSQTVHTLGILCNPKHPALMDFPTDFHSNWQWQQLLDSSKPIVLDSLKDTPQMIVQTIDDWNNCRKLSVLFEAKVAKGKLLVCSMDIINDIDERIVAKQLRHCLLNYMTSGKFDPQIEIIPAQFQKIFKETTLIKEKLIVRDWHCPKVPFKLPPQKPCLLRVQCD